MDADNARGNPGIFTVIQKGEVLYIVPTAVKDAAGNPVATNSPLDTSITFPQQERSGAETLNLICDLVTSASGQRVEVGTVPINLLQQKRVTLKADNEHARDVLLRMVAGLQWKGVTLPNRQLAYQLFYGSDVRMYALNVHMIMQEVRAPSGGVVKIFVERRSASQH